jgi:DNA-damage-inducible protein D
MTQTPNFESIKQTNPYAMEYWSARDLMPLLGYSQWRRFDDAIQRAKISCEQSGNIAEDHFAGAGKVIKAGKGSIQNIKDYTLSRFACYLIAQNGDPRKPEIAAAQAYFAVSTRAHEIHQLREEQKARLEKRLQVSESFKALDRAAKGAGVQSEQFGLFIDAGYVGLHRHTLQELKEIKGISENEEYLDRITRKELSAIDFKNTQTEDMLIRNQIQGLDDAAQTHYFAGDQVRKAIKAMHGPMPEDLPSAPSIRKMVEELNRKKKCVLKPEKEQQNQQLSLFTTED